MTEPIALRIRTQHPATAPTHPGISPQTDDTMSITLAGTPDPQQPALQITHTTYDPTWDGPYDPPTDPSDRNVSIATLPPSGPVANAVASLKSLTTPQQLATLSTNGASDTWDKPDWSSANNGVNASATLFFGSEPTDLPNLHAIKMKDGRWMAQVHGEQGTLLTPQAFTDLLDGARAVRDAAFASA